MNELDGLYLDRKSFSYNDLLGQSKWTQWTPVFSSLTVVGTPSYSGRFQIVGKKCEFQVRFSASTSIASTAGTTYLDLPIPASGLSGMGVMTNQSSNSAVGICHADVANSRLYLPTQAASANIFNLAGWYEI